MNRMSTIFALFPFVRHDGQKMPHTKRHAFPFLSSFLGSVAINEHWTRAVDPTKSGFAQK